MLVRLFGRSLTFARDVPIQGILWGLILGVGMLQADTGVVIGSFTNVQNAQSLKKQSWNLELSLPLQDIRVITNQEGAARPASGGIDTKSERPSAQSIAHGSSCWF
jgi:hypothetical protein